MTQGLPPKPSCFSIVSGILLAGMILAAFAFLPNIVKWVGAAFTILPAQLGLVRAVAPAEVMPVDMTNSPTEVVFAQPGRYALFTSNTDLLSIHEAVLAAKAKPWFALTDVDGNRVAVSMIERGLAFYDTPFARGRPVARFEVASAGTYSMTHPRRPDFVYVVPDYTGGQENQLGFYMLLQMAAVGAAVWYVRRKTRRPIRIVVPPPPTSRTRERYRDEQAQVERPMQDTSAWGEAREQLQHEEALDREPDPGARDVLEMVRAGALTPEQAEAEIEAMMLAQPAGTRSPDWGVPLALTRSEATAYSQGAATSDLLTLRSEGWPSTCIRCGLPLEHRGLKWWFLRDEQGRPALQHIKCPEKQS
jgi:hypothetical protein